MSDSQIAMQTRGIDPTAAYKAYNDMLQSQATVGKIGAETGKIAAETVTEGYRGPEIAAKTATELERPAFVRSETGVNVARLPLIGAETDLARARAITELEHPGKMRAETGLLSAQSGLARQDTGYRAAQTGGQEITNVAAQAKTGFSNSIYERINAAQRDSGQEPTSIFGGGQPGGGQPGAQGEVGQPGTPGIGASPGQPTHPEVSRNGYDLGVGPMPLAMVKGIMDGNLSPEAFAAALNDKRQLLTTMATNARREDGSVDMEAWRAGLNKSYHMGLITLTEAKAFAHDPQGADRMVRGLMAAKDQPFVVGERAFAEKYGQFLATPQKFKEPQLNARGQPTGAMIEKEMLGRDLVAQGGMRAGGAGVPRIVDPSNGAAPKKAYAMADVLGAHAGPPQGPTGYNENDPNNARALAMIKDPMMRQAADLAARSHNIPLPAFVATGMTEGNWNPKTPDGAAGEKGPLQIMPATGAGMGYSAAQLSDPVQNVFAGAKYWADRQAAGQGNPFVAAGAYNTGSVGRAVPEYMQKWAGYYATATGGQGGGPQMPAAAPGQPGSFPALPAAAAPVAPAAMASGAAAPSSRMSWQTGQAAWDPADAPIVKANQEYREKTLEHAQAASQVNNILEDARVASQSWTPGAFAPYKMGALAVADSVQQNFSSLIEGMGGKKDFFGKPSQSVGDWQAYNKYMLQLASAAVKEMASRVTNFEFGTFQKIMPSDSTSPQGTRAVFDQLQGTGDWMQAKSEAAARIALNQGSPNKFEAEWHRTLSPMPFILNRMSPGDQDAFLSNMKKLPEGQKMLDRLTNQVEYAVKNGLFKQAGDK